MWRPWLPLNDSKARAIQTGARFDCALIAGRWMFHAEKETASLIGRRERVVGVLTLSRTREGRGRRRREAAWAKSANNAVDVWFLLIGLLWFFRIWSFQILMVSCLDIILKFELITNWKYNIYFIFKCGHWEFEYWKYYLLVGF